ncbi:MAG TPA: ABC transporter ATP-binding protein [Kofleriaceae bacterium]|nr:ABC transporter ATP-binding protein [Kofleriaceae bacterium]
MIRTEQVSKFFGAQRALGPVSFDIADGEAVGFLGLNGAGKTTALRILACDLRPSSGSVSVDGIDAITQPHEVRKRIGFLPEAPPLHGDMTVRDYLSFAGRVRGMSAAEVKKRLPEVCAQTHLDEVDNALIRHLSHGFRQRVGVAQAIIHAPKLLILDEPTRGLDPFQIVEMRNMIRSLKEHHTILISSHILPEISETCDRLLILGAGSIIAAGTEAELTADVARTGRVIVSARSSDGDHGAIHKVLSAIDGVDHVTYLGRHDGGDGFEIAATGDVRAAVCRTLVENEIDVLRLDRAVRELESVFMSVAVGAGAAPAAIAPPEPALEKVAGGSDAKN